MSLTQADAKVVLKPFIAQMREQTKQMRRVFIVTLLFLLASIGYVGFYVYRWKPATPAQPPAPGTYVDTHAFEDLNVTLNIVDGDGTINWTIFYNHPYGGSHSIRLTDDNGPAFLKYTKENGEKNLTGIVTGAILTVGPEQVRL
jgi:hypothetical protein